VWPALNIVLAGPQHRHGRPSTLSWPAFDIVMAGLVPAIPVSGTPPTAVQHHSFVRSA